MNITTSIAYNRTVGYARSFLFIQILQGGLDCISRLTSSIDRSIPSCQLYPLYSYWTYSCPWLVANVQRSVNHTFIFCLFLRIIIRFAAIPDGSRAIKTIFIVIRVPFLLATLFSKQIEWLIICAGSP